MRPIMLALAAGLAALTGCAVTDVPDLQAGAIVGTVVDKPAVPASSGATYFLVVEDTMGLQTRYEVTFAAYNAVDTGDTLPDDLVEDLPTLDRELTTWR